jgi:hypothetical protein
MNPKTRNMDSGEQIELDLLNVLDELRMSNAHQADDSDIIIDEDCCV